MSDDNSEPVLEADKTQESKSIEAASAAATTSSQQGLPTRRVQPATDMKNSYRPVITDRAHDLGPRLVVGRPAQPTVLRNGALPASSNGIATVRKQAWPDPSKYERQDSPGVRSAGLTGHQRKPQRKPAGPGPPRRGRQGSPGTRSAGLTRPREKTPTLEKPQNVSASPFPGTAIYSSELYEENRTTCQQTYRQEIEDQAREFRDKLAASEDVRRDLAERQQRAEADTAYMFPL